MLKYILIPIGAFFSASALILLRKASSYSNLSKEWFLFFLISIAFYGISLLFYIYLLRLHPISKIYPVITLISLIIITVYGFTIGEHISAKHLFGLALGAGSIYLLLV
jgi:drug/metabolite transporter (DMT)-like permease